MLVSEFDFDLPRDRIAQFPKAKRDQARLLVLERSNGRLRHQRVADLPRLLAPGDLFVINDTRVFPARLLGRRCPNGGAVECLLMNRLNDEHWDALVYPSKKLRVGVVLMFEQDGFRLYAEVLEYRSSGRRTIKLWTEDGSSVDAAVDQLGHMPLPPYVKRPDESVDRERYQTVYAKVRGSVAAPTAGLHLTDSILKQLQARDIEVRRLTLHVGYGTFKPIRVERVEDHRVEPEYYDMPADTALAVGRALSAGRRVVAVGTTTTRTLETAFRVGDGQLQAGRGVSDLYLYPGVGFDVVGGLLTNFHLPRSSLLMLVSAFAGWESVRAAYADALRNGYRFYSYGDAMLIL